ncbi:MAG: sugar transferase [Actinomycetota bacterium]|nr:sugar transferase [Actinomycetota bacterium]
MTLTARSGDQPYAVPADMRATPRFFPAGGQTRALVRRALSVASLVALDLLGVVLGLYAALVLREFYYGRSPAWGSLWHIETDWLPFLTLITVLVFGYSGLYAERERRPEVGRIVSSLVLIALVTLAFAVGTGHHFSTYGLAPTALVTSALFITLLRGSYEILSADLLRFFGARRYVLVAGTGENVSRLHRILGSGRSGIDYEFVGAVAPSAEGIDLPVLGNREALPRVLKENRVDELILTESDFNESELLELVDQAHRRGVKVRVVPKTTELLLHNAEYVPGQALPLFELRPPAFIGSQWLLKRTFDVSVSTLVLLLGLPLWLAIALAVKLTSPGPVFYRDSRIGLGEQEFAMLKFRTMYADAAAKLSQLEEENEAPGPLFKIHQDPRITPLGAYLRRFSLDEVPQVLNVLRGEMSLVGPRPLPLRDYDQLADWHRKRYLVLPGITGLWQIAGRSNLGFDDLVRLDFYYLETWSIWLDMTIMVKTIPAVLSGRGAY